MTVATSWREGTGQQIVLLDDLDMVATEDPLYRQEGDAAWRLERATLNLVADFIKEPP